MGRLLVEILISASGAQASAGIDEVGVSADRTSRKVESLIQSALRGESALRRTAEGAERLKDQMEETKAAKGMIADLGTLNTKLREELQAVKEGAVGIDRLNQKRREEALAARIAATQVRAGVAAESDMGKAIAQEIREQDRLQAELRQTAAARGMSTPAGTGGWRIRLQQLGAEAGNLSQALAPLGIRIGGVSSALAGMGAAIGPLLPLVVSLAAGAGLLYAGFKAFDYLEGVVQKGLETQSVLEKLNNTLRSTGSYAGMSAADIVHLAEGYELLTGREKEEIISAETVLSRFQELGRDAFPKALESVLAYAKMTGDTAEVSANKLGPALAGNARSLNALKDIGIVLTAGQRKMLTEMVETGRVAEYQALLFDILREKIGGVSDEFDKNLIRQAARARIVLDEFGEGIATEVIPALEDLFAELVEQLGGWEKLQFVIFNVGRDVGNVIRQMVYGVILAYHEWAGAQDNLAASIASSFRLILEQAAGVGQALSTMPVPGAELFGASAAVARKAIADLSSAEKSARASANDHAIAILRSTKNLVEHRQALEADTRVYKGHGSAVDSVISKNAEEERKAKQLAKIYKEQMETLRFLTEQKKLADRGPLDLTTRLKEEQRINDEHEYRLSLLKHEEQFGARIAKDLADQEKFLKNLKRVVDVELKTSVKLDPIDMNPAAIRDLNQIMKETEEQLKRDVEAFAEFNRAQAEWLEGFAEGWRESLKSTQDKIREDVAAIGAAVEAGYLTVAEGEAAIAAIRADSLAGQLAGWAGFMSDLGSLVGGGFGRIMSQVSRALQTIQAGQGMGTQLGQLTGASSGMTASLGYAGIVVAVAKIAYDFMKGAQANRYARGYDYAGITGKEAGGSFSIGAGLTGQAREASRQIQDAAKTLAEAMGGVITSFASVEIKVRRDGKYFQSFVEGELVGKFESIDEAIDAAIISAFKSGKTSLFGVSDLVKQGLSQALKIPELDATDLQQFLGSLREIAELSWSDSARQVSATTNRLHELLGELLKVSDASPAVMQGFDDIRASLVRTFQDARRSITGQEMSPAEKRALQEADVKLFNARKALEIARLKQEYEAYKAHASIVAGEGQTTRQFFNIKQRELEGYAAFIQARGQLAQSEAEVYGSTTDAIKAALEATIAALEAIPDIDMSEIGRGGTGRGGSSKGDSRRDFRQEIRDRMADFLGEIGSLFYSMDKEIADLTTRAKEAGVPLSELNELFARMREEAKKTARHRMDELAGITSDIADELLSGLGVFADLRKRGRKETGIPDWLLEIREGQFLEGLKGRFQQSIAEFAGLGDPMIAIRMRSAELRRGLKALADQGLLTAEEIQRAKDMIAQGEEYQRQQGISGILDQLFSYAKQAGIYSAESLEHERQKVQLNLQLMEAQLRMYGALDAATQKIIDDLREWANSPAFGGEGGGSGGVGGNVIDSFTAWKLEQEKVAADLRDEALDILKSWRDAGKSALQRQLEDLAEQMGKVTAAFGNTAEITELHAQRLRSIITDYLEPLQSALDQQKTGSMSSLTGEQKFFESQRQFRELAAQAQAAIVSGNLGAIPDPQELRRLFDQYLEFGQGYTGGEGYRFIESEARGVFQSILDAIPGLAGGGGSAAATGSATSPFTTQSPALQAAIETGNTLLLSEARNQTAILAQIRGHVRDTSMRLGETLSVREVA